MNSHLPLMVMLVLAGCEQDQDAAGIDPRPKPGMPVPGPERASENVADEEGEEMLDDEAGRRVLAQAVGDWEGRGVERGPDGTIRTDRPIRSQVHWVNEGDAAVPMLEVRHTETLPEGEQVLIFTKRYVAEEGIFVLTRRAPGEPIPKEPGAIETYDRDTNTFHGVVRKEELPAGASWTWESTVSEETWTYSATYKEKGVLRWTRVDTFKRIKPKAVN